MFKSLKGKLVASFTAVVLILCLGVSLISMKMTIKHLTEHTYSELQQIAALEAKYIRASQDAEIRYVEALAKSEIILDESVPWEEKVAYFEEEAQRTGFVEFCFTDGNGESTTYSMGQEKCNIKDREYFQKALSGQGAMSDLLIGRNTGKPEFFYAAPVKKDGEIVGVFYGKKNATALSEVASNIQYGETGFGFIVDNNGRVVGSSDEALVTEQFNFIEAAAEDKELQSLALDVKVLDENGNEIELRELDDEMDLSDRELDSPTLGGAELAKPAPDAPAGEDSGEAAEEPEGEPEEEDVEEIDVPLDPEELEKVAGALKNPVRAGRRGAGGGLADDDQEMDEEDLFDEGDEDLADDVGLYRGRSRRRLSDDFGDDEEE